jgi:hypothetical protein
MLFFPTSPPPGKKEATHYQTRPGFYILRGTINTLGISLGT